MYYVNHFGDWFEWTGSTSTMKRYFYAGGVRIAMRVGNPAPFVTIGLYFLFGDHLGSTTLSYLAASSAQSRELYLAWGASRYSSSPPIPTSFRYTGQRAEDVIKLYWYSSRWYDPALSRWVQPDNIIPNPYNALDWDRFAYVRNNAIRYTDPTGNSPACGNSYSDPECEPGYGKYHAIPFSTMIGLYGVEFREKDGGEWTLEQMAWVMLGVDADGRRLSQTKELKGSTQWDAFKNNHGVTSGSPIRFVMGACDPRSWGGGCNGAGAYTWGPREIEFDKDDPFTDPTSQFPGGQRSPRLAAEINIHTVVHELGHAFAQGFGTDCPGSGSPVCAVTPALLGYKGYAMNPPGGDGLWTPNYTNDVPSEAFANMYLGWVYGTLGDQRTLFMTQMDDWVTELVNR